MHSQTLAVLLSAGLVAGQTNTELQTNFPTAASSTGLFAARTIAAGETFDGEMIQWDRSPSTCSDQSEGGDKDAVFILEDGATLSNVVIGPDNGEGIHCKGQCTLNNVWWSKVCEDAATFLQDSGTSYVNGGGARGASDKVLQHNGGGTVAVKNFFASDIGKLYRSCGNCDTQNERHSTFTNIKVADGSSVVAGINVNFGDTTSITDSCILDGADCWLYTGNDSGDEPEKVGSGPDGSTCVVSGVKTEGC
ncbi:pectate lyase [Chaetomium fimeti]|uniref:Pectate lyase n=1 Tax=Chaetomium fimeti TaxID=1854472 RepID=A0AAE0H8R6_9PEZI|nr:pectate lyase [Chaetomium fimeti]